METKHIARLKITCNDQPGIVAAVSQFVKNQGGNITSLDQHSTSPVGGQFFMRLEFHCLGLEQHWNQVETDFDREVAQAYQMKWSIHYADKLKRTAIFVSKYDHALLEVLWRYQRGQLPIIINRVISNHDDLRQQVESFGIPFQVIPVTKQTKADAEQAALEVLDGKTDLIVLARYMQILSDDFVSHYPNQIINIHHSFLPAFVGANPYQKAADRGVKLIGATAHYVTKDLDEGPIIDQDVIRVSHKHTKSDLVNLGKDIERNVLARSVQWHAEDRIIVYENKTVVFV